MKNDENALEVKIYDKKSKLRNTNLFKKCSFPLIEIRIEIYKKYTKKDGLKTS
jgi:hypothetical protein